MYVCRVAKKLHISQQKHTDSPFNVSHPLTTPKKMAQSRFNQKRPRHSAVDTLSRLTTRRSPLLYLYTYPEQIRSHPFTSLQFMIAVSHTKYINGSVNFGA